MYSPKIPERLIPALYRLARARGKPMTAIVAEALDDYLASEGVAQIEYANDTGPPSDLSARPLNKAA
jgi:predicted transcriptional regulator